ncbi:regulatory protein TetR [Gracilinema caldarium DSM 7334]|uniref:Regulatory protein TetR n=2 Tax=Gracilinema caldarium TaxID=215591 RepID=F8EYV3_GRAC1|nr:regulatory protein TetR [Gracilinema caldarium DSM 7334]
MLVLPIMGILERRIRERQRRVEEILEGAKRIFSTKGFTNTTMNDIADSSELSRRTVYLYFNSKEQVSLAITAAALKELSQIFGRIAKEEGTAFERLGHIIEAYQDMMAEDQAKFQFFVSFTENARSVPKDCEEFVSCEQSLLTIEHIIANLLQQGLAEGSLQFSEDPKYLAALLTFMVHSLAAASISYKGIFSNFDDTFITSLFTGSLQIIKQYVQPKQRQEP